MHTMGPGSLADFVFGQYHLGLHRCHLPFHISSSDLDNRGCPIRATPALWTRPRRNSLHFELLLDRGPEPVLLHLVFGEEK